MYRLPRIDSLPRTEPPGPLTNQGIDVICNLFGWNNIKFTKHHITTKNWYVEDLPIYLDLQLLLSDYLYNNYISVWLKLIELSKGFYPALLYTCRRYRVKPYNIKEFINGDRWSIINNAAINNFNSIVKSLIDLEQPADYYWTIYNAAKNCNFKIVLMLESLNTNKNYRDVIHETLNNKSISTRQKLKIVKYLAPLSTDKNYNYTIENVSKSGFFKAVEILAPLSNNKFFRSAINSAISWRRPDIVKLLEKYSLN